MTTEPAGASPVDCQVRRLLPRLRNGPAPLGDPNLNDEAADMIERLQSDCKKMRGALRQVAQAHAWLAFGDCRSFGSDVQLLSPNDADALARVALGEYREGPNE